MAYGKPDVGSRMGAGRVRAMGENARLEYEAKYTQAKYTPVINYRQLLAIYEEAITVQIVASSLM